MRPKNAHMNFVRSFRVFAVLNFDVDFDFGEAATFAAQGLEARVFIKGRLNRH